VSGPILVVKLGALGDVAQALPAMQAIRDAHPGARLTLLTTRPFVGIFRACPWFAAVWEDGRAPLWRLDRWLALRARIRAAGFARVYDLQTADRTDWYFALLGPGARPEWVGTARGASHRHADPARDRMHTAERLAAQLALAGVATPAAADLAWLDGDAGRFGLRPPYALIVPGASPHRPEKRWPAERFGALAGRLAGRGLMPVAVGAASEAALTRAVRDHAGMTVDLAGRTTIADLAALARGAALAVGNDTGPMHWFAAAGCPTLTLFSAASDPALCAPRGSRATILRRDRLADLPVNDVADAALALAETGTRPG
jgi:ADP-heptose:LPS heptosyltransferase